ncbi:MAG: iron-containing alcohol dehydrogenase [Candidatus Cloacimonas sp.]|nr:iron-containing alcohol dehydrogenase [Candidatus Cloacimonadota bacterium]
MIWSTNKDIRVVAGKSLYDAIDDIPIDGSVFILSSPFFQNSGAIDELTGRLSNVEIKTHIERINNPDITQLKEISNKYSQEEFDWIIGIGGGSIIDAAKVLSVILPEKNENKILKALQNNLVPNISDNIPVVAVPTTSGTGAECTQFATVWDLVNGHKYSLESDSIIPEYVILDPRLTLQLPFDQTLFTGLDALSHATESLWNKKFNPIARATAKEAITLIVSKLPIVLEQSDNLEARTAMQNASFLAGVAICQTKTAIAHAISYPLTYKYKISHGLACSFTIPALYELIQSNNDIDKDSLKYVEMSANFIKGLNLIEYLRTYVQPAEIVEMIDEMNNPQRFSNFAVAVNKEQLKEVLCFSLNLH